MAACCGPFDYINPSTEEKIPYVNNCLFDSVQQLCHGLPYFIRKRAMMSDKIWEKEALNSIANTIENKAGECLDSLWGTGSPGPDGSQVNELAGTTWSPIQDLTFTLDLVTVDDWTQEGEVTWTECGGIYDNDDAIIPTAPFTVPGSIRATTLPLRTRATMTGSAPGLIASSIEVNVAESSLTIAIDDSTATLVTGLRLESAASVIQTDAGELTLTRASLTLRDVMAPMVKNGFYLVPSGRAQFVAAVAFEGDTRIVDVTNRGPIILRQVEEMTWSLESFEVAYIEPGFGRWSLSFDGMTFAESP